MHPRKRLISVIHRRLTGAACAVGLVGVLVGITASPVSAADFTWSGAATDPLWTDPANWSGAVPSGPIGTLSFPLLTGGACGLVTSPSACYTGDDDLSGLTADALSIDDAEPYLMTGTGFGLGSGGITASPVGTPSADVLSFLDLPLTLTAPQTWSITGDGLPSEFAVRSATGPREPLTIDFAADARLGVGAGAADNSEVGPITASGAGAVVVVGSLDATDGNPLTLQDGAGLVATSSGAAVGPVTATGGYVRVGHGEAPDDGTLQVAGAVSLDAASRAVFFIDQPGPMSGPVAGTDFTQLTATGNVDLGGAALDLYQGVVGATASCQSLTAGTSFTLISTTGTLSGTFAGVPNGATVPVTTPCSAATDLAPSATITYSSNAVTATIAPYPTTIVVTTAPAGPVVNEPVTLTAVVAAGGATPDGTVSFDRGGAPIDGCTDVPLTTTVSLATGGTSYVATCTTSFSATTPSQSVTATFTPAGEAEVSGSTSLPTGVAIARDGTSTALSAADAVVAPGAPVGFSASVTADHPGPAAPSGTVTFFDAGTAIPACSSRPLANGVATCTAALSAPGAQAIQAVYSGDGDFSGSASSTAATVTVTGGGRRSSVVSPTPVLGRSAAVRAVTGVVLIRLPHSNRFVALHAGQSIPLGATLDTLHGSVALTFARPAPASRARAHLGAEVTRSAPRTTTATKWAQFSQGDFVIVQTRSGLVVAVLAGGSFRGCRIKPRSLTATIAAARPIRKLVVHDHGGSFGTRGAYVATAVVGTEWLTEDFCTGSEVQVTLGTVRVTSLVTHRSRLVHARHATFVAA